MKILFFRKSSEIKTTKLKKDVVFESCYIDQSESYDGYFNLIYDDFSITFHSLLEIKRILIDVPRDYQEGYLLLYKVYT